MEPKVARILIDARKLLAGKMYHKFFSDGIEIKHNDDINDKEHKKHISIGTIALFKKQNITIKTDRSFLI